MKPALSQVCSLSSPFADNVADYAKGRCGAIEVWLTKLEQHLARNSIEETKALFEEHGLEIPVASYQGGLFERDAARQDVAWEHFLRRLDWCRDLNVGTVVVAADFVSPLEQDDIERMRAALTRVSGEAGKRGMRVALEFQGHSSFCNNVETAAALVAEAGSSHLGICFDVFHYYTGPSKLEDLVHLDSENLYHVQLCDLADTPRELALDSQRILPGDGDFQLEPLIEHLRKIGYSQFVSVEIMDPRIWQVPALQFGEIGMTALRNVLGLSSMR